MPAISIDQRRLWCSPSELSLFDAARLAQLLPSHHGATGCRYQLALGNRVSSASGMSRFTLSSAWHLRLGLGQLPFGLIEPPPERGAGQSRRALDPF